MVTLRDKFLGCIAVSWAGEAMGATAEGAYTNNSRTIDQTAEGLLGAFRARHRRLAEYVAIMGQEEA